MNQLQITTLAEQIHKEASDIFLSIPAVAKLAMPSLTADAGDLLTKIEILKNAIQEVHIDR